MGDRQKKLNGASKTSTTIRKNPGPPKGKSPPLATGDSFVEKSQPVKRVRKSAVELAEPISTGTRIRNLRLKLGLNQSQFAGKLGMSQSYLSDIENKKSEVPTLLLNNIAYIYSVRPDWLFNGTGEMFVSGGNRVPFYRNPSNLESIPDMHVTVPFEMNTQGLFSCLYRGLDARGSIIRGDLLFVSPLEHNDVTHIVPGAFVASLSSTGEIEILKAADIQKKRVFLVDEKKVDSEQFVLLGEVKHVLRHIALV